MKTKQIKQYAKVSKVEDFHECKKITLVPDGKTKKFADFKAGQYVIWDIPLEGKVYHKPHSIASSPKYTDRYEFWIKEHTYGFTSKYINKKFKVGTKLTISLPKGKLPIRVGKDQHHIIACCEGNAMTPFLAMAQAIADNKCDRYLTIIHSVNYNRDLIFKPDLLKILEKTKNFKLINLVAKEPSPDWLEGIIDLDIIKKTANNKPFTLLACGSPDFYHYMDKIVEKLKLPKDQYRKEELPK